MKLRSFLKSKLHMARVTEANLEYEGSITIDEDLMRLADIMPYEFVLISNMNNGERFETYVIPGAAGSGMVCLNGPTARKGMTGDRVIVFSLLYATDEELKAHKPRIVMLDENNKPKK